jgi:putative spermidine/putrescine transport system ATP-binding protein
MASLDLQDISKRYSNLAAVDTLSLSIADGELMCLLGPSGSGKSTLLRMIGGFEIPSSGKILIDGVDVAPVPPDRRPTAMVFQSHALWTHMNVWENIAFGLKLRKFSRDEIAAKITRVMELVGLTGYEKRHPTQLSGGQQQRVAIARSIVLEPKILLLDEPFASLDQHLREHLREEVRQIQRQLGITTIFVTHGQDEALALADRIVVMSKGKIEQVGTPDEIYARPQTEFVAGFIGVMNLIPVAVSGGAVPFAGLTLHAPVADGAAALAIRPEDWKVGEGAGLKATITRTVNLGAYILADVALADGTSVKVHLDKARAVREGDPIEIGIGPFALYRNNTAVHRS